MGREIKRVPLDFSHPVGEEWPGYVNEHYHECPVCRGRGTTAAMEYLANLTRNLVWHINGLHGKDYEEIAQLTTGLCRRSPQKGLLGHDSIDEGVAREAIIKAAGLDPETWGHCPNCNGEGIDPEYQAAYDAWEQTEPPEGDGWQVWENVSEGSPVSPVFATADDLVQWLIEQGYSEAAARAFVKQGYALTMAIVDGVIYNDIESAIA